MFYYVYSLHPHGDEVHRRLSGKFALDENGIIHVLEDHAGLLKGIDGEDSDKVAKKLNSLQNSMYTEIVDANDIASGMRPDLIPETVEPEQADKNHSPAAYLYHRVGMDKPQTLSFEDGMASLDGYKLSDVELGRMIENLRNQRASLSRLQDSIDEADAMKKYEGYYESMAKADPKLSEALGHVRNAVKSGQMHPDVLKTLTSHIYKDTMTGFGNKHAYEDFLSRPKQGVRIHLDGSKFGQINKIHGFHHGDSAIKSMGTAIRSALDESVGRKNSKSFRSGGDEFVLHVPTHQHAARFVRSLKQHLDKIPPVQNQHKLAMDIGVGTDEKTAEHALIQAKTYNKSRNLPLHELKTHAYSAVPGFEGHLADEE